MKKSTEPGTLKDAYKGIAKAIGIKAVPMNMLNQILTHIANLITYTHPPAFIVQMVFDSVLYAFTNKSSMQIMLMDIPKWYKKLRNKAIITVKQLLPKERLLKDIRQIVKKVDIEKQKIDALTKLLYILDIACFAALATLISLFGIQILKTKNVKKAINRLIHADTKWKQIVKVGLTSVVIVSGFMIAYLLYRIRKQKQYLRVLVKVVKELQEEIEKLPSMVPKSKYRKIKQKIDAVKMALGSV